MVLLIRSNMICGEMIVRTVDLFCGCGGMSLGFQNAGFEIVGAFDLWNSALACYNTNFSHQAIILDLSKKNTALRHIRPLNPEVIIGGPPCQDFSSAGERTEGARANLTVSFAKLIKSLRPKYFIMENVSRAQMSQAYKEARKLFKDAGYGLTEQILDASKCGVPQKRKRLFCIGALNEEDGFLDAYLSHNQSVLPMTVRQYFTANHIQLPGTFYYRHPRSYSRRAIYSVDEPSPTIRGVNRPKPPEYQKHASDAADPDDVRSLTFRERALIQTFPGDFQFGENQMEVEQMIGNAVPVNLAFHVANALSAYENKREHATSLEFSDWLRISYGYSALAIKDTISRVGRSNKIVPIDFANEQEYIKRLDDETTSLSKNIRSQLKRAVKLYFEFLHVQNNGENQ